MPRITRDPERRLRVTLKIDQRTGEYGRDAVAEATVTAEYPLDLEEVLTMVRGTLGLIVANVDVAHGAIATEVEVPAREAAVAAPRGPLTVDTGVDSDIPF